MPKLIVTQPKEFYQHYPRVAAAITSSAEGKDNVMAAAWHSPISREPLLYGVAISPKRYSYDLVLRSKEFGVNFLPFKKVQLITDVGNTKGNEINKFTEFHIARDMPVKTSVPILKDAYAVYECIVVGHSPYGDHEWIVGEIVAVHLEKTAFNEEGMLDMAQVKPILYLSQDRYLTINPKTLKVLERKNG